MFMDPATDVVLPFNWCACSVLLYLCVLVLAACAVGAVEEADHYIGPLLINGSLV